MRGAVIIQLQTAISRVSDRTKWLVFAFDVSVLGESRAIALSYLSPLYYTSRYFSCNPRPISHWRIKENLFIPEMSEDLSLFYRKIL